MKKAKDQRLFCKMCDEPGQIWLLSMWWLLGNHSCHHSSPSVSANNSAVHENPVMIEYQVNQKTINWNNEE